MMSVLEYEHFELLEEVRVEPHAWRVCVRFDVFACCDGLVSTSDVLVEKFAVQGWVLRSSLSLLYMVGHQPVTWSSLTFYICSLLTHTLFFFLFSVVFPSFTFLFFSCHVFCVLSTNLQSHTFSPFTSFSKLSLRCCPSPRFPRSFFSPCFLLCATLTSLASDLLNADICAHHARCSNFLHHCLLPSLHPQGTTDATCQQTYSFGSCEKPADFKPPSKM